MLAQRTPLDARSPLAYLSVSCVYALWPLLLCCNPHKITYETDSSELVFHPNLAVDKHLSDLDPPVTFTPWGCELAGSLGYHFVPIYKDRFD